MEWVNGDYSLSDDPARIDLDRAYELIANTYWAAGRTKEAVGRSIQNSLSFALLHRGVQVGLARVLTDKTFIAWLCDVVIEEGHRGKGVGQWMLACILAHPDVKETKLSLATRDAHGFYEKFGFERAECMRRQPRPKE